MESNQVCDIPHLGTHWYNKNAITNIISLAHMTEKFRVTFDSAIEKSLNVHLPNKIIKFYQMQSGLYGMNPMDDSTFIKTVQAQFLNTVQENMAFLTPRQQQKAKQARKLYEAMGTPTVTDLKSMIWMNLIKNNKVTTEDVN